MLTRQKVLLQFLEVAGRPVQRIELMKWCFLLRHQSRSRGGSAFYDFVPYQRGPFSFALYQEVHKLEGESYIGDSGPQAWRLEPRMAGAIPPVDSALRGEIESLLRKLSGFSADKLIDYVYTRYPYYTVNSEIRRLAERPVAEPAVYTAGYEGLSVDAFLNMLVVNGIRRLVDVRNNPIARRYGFHKSTLGRLAGHLGIEYVHVPELGICSEKRQGLGGGADRKALFRQYERTTLVEEKSAIRRVSGMMQEVPSVLVCMEAEPSCCHRSHLADPVSKLTGLPIIHLRPN